MKKKELRDRIEYLMVVKKIESVTDIVPLGDSLYQKVYRQLFNNKDADITYDVLVAILEKYPDVSSDWLVKGEGGWERKTHIVTTTKQEIHVDGGQAAISQSGDAKVETPAPKDNPTELFSPADIAKWVSEGNVGALVGVIFAQKDEIIRLKEQRIADLEHSVRIADNQLFPDVK